MKKFMLIGSLALNLALLVALFFSRSWSFMEPDRPVTSHTVVVEKIAALGKMELVQYNFQDIVTHEVLKDWWPFDPKVMLMVQGEAIGCVDFSKMDSTMITRTTDTLFLRLPQPEICMARINHERSRVYDTRFTAFEKADLVDEAYRKAEEAIFKAALRAQILEQTKAQAIQTLEPMFERFAEKAVIITFPEEPSQPVDW